MIVRICSEAKCRTQLSAYNPTTRCWDHRRSTRRIEGELSGRFVQRDDAYALGFSVDAEIETWRPHMCSETFVRGLERRELNARERVAYDSGEWL